VLGAYAMLPGAANLGTIDFEIRDPADQVRGSTTSTMIIVSTMYSSAREAIFASPRGEPCSLSRTMEPCPTTAAI